MNLQEIINRPINSLITNKECLFVIKQYIKTRKGVDVDPELNFQNGTMTSIKEISLMKEMTATAIQWFIANNYD